MIVVSRRAVYLGNGKLGCSDGYLCVEGNKEESTEMIKLADKMMVLLLMTHRQEGSLIYSGNIKEICIATSIFANK